MLDRIVTGFFPLLQARMSQLIAIHKKCTILMLSSKRSSWKLKFKIILYRPEVSLFMESLNKNPVCAQVYCTVHKEDTPDSLTNP